MLNPVVVQVATPEAFKGLALQVGIDAAVTESLKSTVPGTPGGPGTDRFVEVTVAVNVTLSPGLVGFFEDVSAVAVFDLFTTCGSPVRVPVLVLKFASSAL